MLGSQLVDLTEKLILGAGEDVVELAEKEEREQLEIFQGLITKRLSILRGGGIGKSERNGAGRVVVVNGAGNGDGVACGHATRNGNERGISKSKSTSTSKSRERRGVSRGRK